jgi:hypothetical protein
VWERGLVVGAVEELVALGLAVAAAWLEQPGATGPMLPSLLAAAGPELGEEERAVLERRMLGSYAKQLR